MTDKSIPQLLAALKTEAENSRKEFDSAHRAAAAHDSNDGVGQQFDYVSSPAEPTWIPIATALTDALETAHRNKTNPHPVITPQALSDTIRLLEKTHSRFCRQIQKDPAKARYFDGNFHLKDPLRVPPVEPIPDLILCKSVLRNLREIQHIHHKARALQPDHDHEMD